MLNMALLPAKENKKLQMELRREYITESYSFFINDILSFLNNIDKSVVDITSHEVFLVLNKILLDNTFKYIVDKTPELFIKHIVNNTFSKDIYIRPYYVLDVLEKFNLCFEDRVDLEFIVNRKIQQYINYIYTSNASSYNICLTNLFEIMYQNFHYIDIIKYKFELYNDIQPILLYTCHQN